MDIKKMDFFKKEDNKTTSEKARELLKREEVQPLAETQKKDIVKPDHKHEWELLSKTYAPSRRDLSATVTLDRETVERMLFGVTVFLWECLVCRELRKESVLGSDVTQLDEMIDKADKYGPQYIQRTDGVTFVLGKHTAPTGSLPMR